MIRLLATVMLMLSILSACGFQLRGHDERSLSFAQIYLVPSTDNPLFRERLVEVLAATGSTLVADKASATTILKLDIIEDIKRLISINAIAQGRDYSLFKRVKFSLSDRQGTALITDRLVEVRRDYVKTPVDALGNDQQEEELQRELELALIQAILLQMQFQ